LIARLATFLQIRPGEGRLAALVAGLFALLEAGKGFGSNAADALFFRRFGVENLPYMFMFLGAASFLVALTYTAALGRFQKGRLFAALFVILPAALLIERAAVLLEQPALYPVVWITVNMIGSVLGLVTWNIAGEVCDARQAKRLFSLFVSAGILGGVVGNLITGPFAQALGTENLMVLYAALLVVAFLLIRDLARRYFRAQTRGSAQAGFIDEVRVGFDFVRGSTLLKLMVAASVLFSILYFSMSFPFSKAVSQRFPDEASLAGFLGTFSGVVTAVTFLASLFVANRLYARIGAVNAILILPVTYLAGFVLFAADFSLTTAVVARAAQLIILGGIAGSAWGTLFNTVPSEKRGQVIAFENGVPSQIGVALSGVLLVLGERGMTTSQIFLMGMVVAVACGALVWFMRGSYGQALVAALRAGRFDVFSAGERAFAGFRGDATAIRAALAALRDPKPSLRRLAAEMLARMNAVSSVPALIDAARDPDPEVRASAIESLHALAARQAVSTLVELLGDADARVRASALWALPDLEPGAAPGAVSAVETLLRDPDVYVRVQAAVALARFGETARALPTLDALLRDPDPITRCRALGALGEIAEHARHGGDGRIGFSLTPVADATRDPSAAVRRAACETLGRTRDAPAIEPLIACLDDGDAAVRAAAAQALRSFGAQASARLLDVLRGEETLAHDAALDALDPADPAIVEPLHDYAHREVTWARDWRALAAALPDAGRVTRLLRETLSARASQSEQRLVKTVGVLGHREAMDWVGRGLDARDAETRAAAIETLETLGDKHLAREIIPLLENTHAAQPITPSGTALALAQLLVCPDGWLRALAARAVVEVDARSLVPDLQSLESDADRLARDAARDAIAQLSEGESMETLKTVSLMERILLLREVPLFADLSPDDLKQIADVAREQVFSAGDMICREGEEGDSLYVLAGGEAHVVKRSNGGEKLIATRKVGDFLGEMSIVDSAPRFASVRAAGEVRALVLDGDTFKAILRDRPEVSLAVLRGLSRRLRERE
jgi:HEAT repeat protein